MAAQRNEKIFCGVENNQNVIEYLVQHLRDRFFFSKRVLRFIELSYTFQQRRRRMMSDQFNLFFTFFLSVLIENNKKKLRSTYAFA